jgi:hypothetical protein
MTEPRINGTSADFANPENLNASLDTLACPVTGNTADPSKIAAFQWNMINNVIVAAERIGPSGNNCSGSSIEAFRKAQAEASCTRNRYV